MASAESASASLGPRYAPEDPTLPKPWMGLIDGSTGLQYYWNPETNVTQYERPATAVPPPVPAVLPPSAVAPPKTEGLPASQNGNSSLPVQQGIQQSQQMQYHQSSQQSQLQQQQQQQPNQQMQYHQPSYPQPSQQSYPQQPTLQFSQQPPIQQQLLHHQPVQMMPQMQHQQIQHQPMQHQQVPYPQVQQTPQSQVQPQPTQQIVQQRGQQGGYQMVDEPGSQYGKQGGYASAQLQPSSAGIPPNPNISAGPGSSQVQIPQVGVHSLQQKQILGPPSNSINGQQSTGTSLLQMQPGVDAIQRQPQIGSGSRTSNQMVQGMGTNLAPIGPPAGMKELGDDLRGRTRPDFYSHGPSPREMHEMGLQQPKLAALPVVQNLQEMRSSAPRPQNFAPGPAPGFNMPSARPMPSSYTHVGPGQPFPNAPLMGPPGMLGSADTSRPCAADVYRRQHEVSAMGENVPAPFMTFETTGFPPEILREMHFAGFLSPTPIQAQTWPVAAQGRDIVAIAKTGSGKTLGYLIPAFLHLRRLRNNPQIGPTVLVLSPTRELATQIQDEAMKFGRSSGVSCTCLYGGAPKGPQIREIERGVDIVIATPGRLNDILEMSKIDFRQVSFLVLDEADRMLDMGFEPQIRKIVNEIPPRRQTLMYTATWPKEVRKIAGDLLFNPVQVNIGNTDELSANKAITQYVEVVPPMDKQRRLEQILRSQERGSKVIIFCSTKRQCDQLARSIGRGFGATAIHGDKSQGERDWALNQFRNGNKPILVATDVAARGLDIKDIRVVINFDFPTGIEDYVHRIGRTGRAGATGISYTFFSDQDWKYAADLIKVLERANQRVPPEIREMAERGAPAFSKGRGGISRWDSGGGRWDSGGGRGMRDASNGFGGRGGRGDHFGGRVGRGRGFGGPRGRSHGGPGPHDRYGYMEGRGSRFDNRRAFGERNRDAGYSRSPERGRARGYDRSRSPSRSRSRSWSRSPSYSHSRSRSWSRSRSRSHSRSNSNDRFDRPQGQNYNRPARVSGFDILPPTVAENPPSVADNPVPSVSNNPSPSVMVIPQTSGSVVPQLSVSVAPLAREMSPMSPGVTDTGSYLKSEPIEQVSVADQGTSSFPAAIAEPLPGPYPN